jgi:hypothetical protein
MLERYVNDEFKAVDRDFSNGKLELCKKLWLWIMKKTLIKDSKKMSITKVTLILFVGLRNLLTSKTQKWRKK